MTELAKMVRGAAVALIGVVIVLGLVFAFTSDLREERRIIEERQACLEKGGRLVNDYVFGRICVKYERIN